MVLCLGQLVYLTRRVLGLMIEQLTCVVSAYGGAAVRYTGKRGTLINKDSLSSADESSALLITRPAPKLLIPLFCTLSPLHTRAHVDGGGYRLLRPLPPSGLTLS